MRRTRLSLALAILLLCLVLSGSALAGPQEKFRSGQTVLIRTDQIIPHDLYVTASRIHLRGRVEGDLVAAGGEVVIDGTVTGDLWVAAGEFLLTGSGRVEGDVRAAAGTIQIGGAIGEDLLVMGGTLMMSPQAHVGEDLLLAVGEADLEGRVAGGVLGSASTYLNRGEVGGSQRVRTAPEPGYQSLLLRSLEMLASLLIVGALISLIWPQRLDHVTAQAQGRPAAAMGWGLLSFLGFGLGIILAILATVLLALTLNRIGLSSLALTVTLTGITASLLLLLGFMVGATYVSRVIAGLVVGKLALSRLAGSEYPRLLELALGLILLAGAAMIPQAGPALMLLATALGLGSLLMALWVGVRRRP